MMKYKVFFDSNQIFNSKGSLIEPFDLALVPLYDLLKQHKKLNLVNICFSDLVVKERIQTKLEEIEGKLQKLNDSTSALKLVGYKFKIPKSLTRGQHKKILEKKADAFIKKYNIERIKNEKVDLDNLIERCIDKRKPFNDKGVGLKDTLIYLSMVEDAQTTQDEVEYIFCTNNKTQFDENVEIDFKELTGKSLYIVRNIEAAKEKLDELLPLGLHLENRNAIIREFILSKTGTITKLVNNAKIPQQRDPYGLALRSSYSPLGEIDLFSTKPYRYKEDDIIGYNYQDIELLNFEEVDQNSYRVEAKLELEVLYRDKTKETHSLVYSDPATIDTFLRDEPYYAGRPSFSNYPFGLNMFEPQTRIFGIRIICNLDSKHLEIENLY